MRLNIKQFFWLVVLSLIAAVVLYAQVRNSGTTNASADSLCTTNLVIIRVQLHDWGWNGAALPRNLGPLSKVITNSDVFVCPASGHQPGSVANIDEWTDYIYFVQPDDSGPPKVPLLICPPENHNGEFGNVMWRDGNRSRLTPEEIRALIKEPWIMEKSADFAELQYMKETIQVHIPSRFRSTYSNAYAPGVKLKD